MIDLAPLGKNVLLGLVVPCLGLVGPLAAVGVLSWRKRRVRELKRSPLSGNLLRSPGQSVRDQMSELRLDAMGDIALLGMLPYFFVCLHLSQSYVLGHQETVFRYWMLGISILGFVSCLCVKLIRQFRRVDALSLGLDAELAVGQELDQLMRQGAVVYHDFPCDNFNIDHVVLAPQGVFAVETKGYAKPNRQRGVADAKVEFDGKVLKFPTWTTTKPIDQAKRQARWLSQWLASAVGSPIAVTPVLALPGWYVERKGRGEVWLFSGKELTKLLSLRGAPPLAEQDLQRVSHQIEQRCRDVKPKFREGE